MNAKNVNSVFDSDYKVAHMKNMHNGQNFECIAVLEASQSTLSGYFAKSKAPVKCTAGESGQEQEQADSEQCHSVIQEIHEEEQAKDQQAHDENSTEKETFQAPHEKEQAKDQQAHDESSTEKETSQEIHEEEQTKDEQAHEESDKEIEMSTSLTTDDYDETSSQDEQQSNASLDFTVNQELDLERPQQPLLRQFPGRKFGNENFVRRFKPEWYKTYTWVSYSTGKDESTCFACSRFSKEFSFVFNNWTKPYKLSKHNASEKHLNSMTKWVLYKAASNNSSSVLKQLDSFHSEKVESNRQYLQIIIECIMFAAQQNIAVRVHEESRQNIWEVSVINRGNFWSYYI